jgi:hypothetical protein
VQNNYGRERAIAFWAIEFSCNLVRGLRLDDFASLLREPYLQG